WHEDLGPGRAAPPSGRSPQFCSWAQPSRRLHHRRRIPVRAGRPNPPHRRRVETSPSSLLSCFGLTRVDPLVALKYEWFAAALTSAPIKAAILMGIHKTSQGLPRLSGGQG